MAQLGPQRGPARAQDGEGLDPQLQALIDKHGMEAVRAMAKSAMAGGAPTLPSSPAGSPMQSLMGGTAPAAGASMPRSANGQSPLNIPGGRGGPGGFVNPAGMGADARANEAAMRERLVTQMALFKLSSMQSGEQKAKSAAPAAGATQASQPTQPAQSVAAPVVHPSAPHPAAGYQQPTLAQYISPTFAPAAQATSGPVPVSGWKLLIGAVAIAAVVGGGAAYIASKASDEPRRAHR